LTELASVEPAQALGAYGALSGVVGAGNDQSFPSDEPSLLFDGTIQSSMPSAGSGLLADPLADAYGRTVIRKGPLAVHHGSGFSGGNRGSFGIGAPACASHEKGPRQGAFGCFGMSEEQRNATVRRGALLTSGPGRWTQKNPARCPARAQFLSFYFTISTIRYSMSIAIRTMNSEIRSITR
jgi:hypothetical protein